MTFIARLAGTRHLVTMLVGSLVLFALAVGYLVSRDRPVEQSSPPSAPVVAERIERYVSPNGRDTWSGTKAQPWRTLKRALPAMRPNQLLYVRGGNYYEQVVRIGIEPGTAAEPITVMAYPGENPVLHGLIWLWRPSYWTIDGLNVTWDRSMESQPRFMVKLTGGVGWRWNNSEVWGSRGSSNVYVAGYGHDEPADWSIANSCIHDVHSSPLVGRTSNLSIGGMENAGPGLVSRNLIFNAMDQQNVAIGSAANGSTDVVLEYNTVYGASTAVTIAGDTRRVQIMKNILSNTSTGVLVRSTASKGSRNIVAQNLGDQAVAFFRPRSEPTIGGPGNVLYEDLGFSDTSTCQGFHSAESASLPYGRYALQ